MSDGILPAELGNGMGAASPVPTERGAAGPGTPEDAPPSSELPRRGILGTEGMVSGPLPCVAVLWARRVMDDSSKNVPASLLDEFDASELLNLLADGAYITDADRRIVFWNDAAARITGWLAEDVVGRTCFDNLLVHVDKDGHALCGQEHCPLHRSIVTGHPSSEPLVVFAQHKWGHRTPVEVTVSPVRNHAGQVIGGIEMFRDLTAAMQDQLRAKRIQDMAVTCVLPEDDRVSFEMCCQQRDVVGGDFYRIERLNQDCYAVLVADAMGHGVAAALHTMQLRSLWDDHRMALGSPDRFVGLINQRLHGLVRGEGYFGTAVYVVYDAATGELRCVRAGHPAPLLFRAGGAVESVGSPNPALGVHAESPYRETVVPLGIGDAVLLFTDGATEVGDGSEKDLGRAGLAELARKQNASSDPAGFHLEQLEKQLLEFSDQIHLADDLTLVKIRREA